MTTLQDTVEGRESASKKRVTRFNIETIMTMQDELIVPNSNLRALGRLISDSDLQSFAGADTDEEELRYGLKGLIDLCINEQERIVENCVTKYQDSEMGLYEHAEDTLSLIKQGAFSSSEAQASAFVEGLEELDMIIHEDGERKGKAGALKAEFLKLQAQRII